jgi:hypothetical protein
MNKMKLDLDALAVESFETQESHGRGTVVGAAELQQQAHPVPGTYPNCSQIDACPSAWVCTPNGTCNDPSCMQGTTCVKTCVATCQSCPSICFDPVCSGPICAY